MAEKILVIDDEETTVQLISILLERRGYEVIKAYRAEDGLRKATAGLTTVEEVVSITVGEAS